MRSKSRIASPSAAARLVAVGLALCLIAAQSLPAAARELRYKEANGCGVVAVMPFRVNDTGPIGGRDGVRAKITIKCDVFRWVTLKSVCLRADVTGPDVNMRCNGDLPVKVKIGAGESRSVSATWLCYGWNDGNAFTKGVIQVGTDGPTLSVDSGNVWVDCDDGRLVSP